MKNEDNWMRGGIIRVRKRRGTKLRFVMAGPICLDNAAVNPRGYV